MVHQWNVLQRGGGSNDWSESPPPNVKVYIGRFYSYLHLELFYPASVFLQQPAAGGQQVTKVRI
jgi:hypothetical protein